RADACGQRRRAHAQVQHFRPGATAIHHLHSRREPINQLRQDQPCEIGRRDLSRLDRREIAVRWRACCGGVCEAGREVKSRDGHLLAGLQAYVTQDAAEMPEPRERDLLLLPLEFLGRGLENLSAGDQMLGGVCGSYRLELLFDSLTRSPVTNEREVSKHQFLRRACDRLRKLCDSAVCYGNERLSVLGIEQRHHRPGQVARKEDAIAMRQPGFTLHFLTKRLAEGYGAGN